MNEWQPIETAPANVPVLLYQAPRELFEGYWIPDNPRMIVGTMGGIFEPTTCNIGGWECECEVDKPTHWMPLPEPPKSSDVTNHGTGQAVHSDENTRNS